jgi:hypothetical protein
MATRKAGSAGTPGKGKARGATGNLARHLNALEKHAAAISDRAGKLKLHIQTLKKLAGPAKGAALEPDITRLTTKGAGC